MCWRDAFCSAADVIFNTIKNAPSPGQENNEKVHKYWIPRRLGREDQFKAERYLFLKNSYAKTAHPSHCLPVRQLKGQEQVMEDCTMPPPEAGL